MENQLITEIEDFARKTGMKESVVCRLATGNAKLHARMKDGGACSIRTAYRLRQWMASWEPKPAQHQREGA